MNYTKADIILKDDNVRFIASTARSDSHGDIINPKGWDLSDYKNNPVVLFAHKTRDLPVGKATARIKNNQLIADIEFLPPGVDAFADKIKLMVKHKFLNAVSVGFKALDMEPRFNKDGQFIGYKFNKQALTEISIVPVGANADALQLAKSLNFNDDDLNAILIKPDQAESNLKSYQHRLNKARARV